MPRSRGSSKIPRGGHKQQNPRAGIRRSIYSHSLFRRISATGWKIALLSIAWARPGKAVNPAINRFPASGG
jgi:hypothetical protein